MKKILTVLLVSMMMCCLPMTLMADENDNEVTGGSATVALTASKASSYTVKLPRTVDVSNTTQTFNVFAKGDIWADKQLDIAVGSGTHALSDVVASGGKSPTALTVTVSGGAFTAADLEADYSSRKAVFTITHAELPAGNFAYDLPISIAINDLAD